MKAADMASGVARDPQGGVAHDMKRGDRSRAQGMQAPAETAASRSPVAGEGKPGAPGDFAALLRGEEESTAEDADCKPGPDTAAAMPPQQFPAWAEFLACVKTPPGAAAAGADAATGAGALPSSPSPGGSPGQSGAIPAGFAPPLQSDMAADVPVPGAASRSPHPAEAHMVEAARALRRGNIIADEPDRGAESDGARMQESGPTRVRTRAEDLAPSSGHHTVTPGPLGPMAGAAGQAAPLPSSGGSHGPPVPQQIAGALRQALQNEPALAETGAAPRAFRLVLKPDGTGSVHIALRLAGGKLAVTLAAPTTQVQAVLERDRDVLGALLVNAGAGQFTPQLSIVGEFSRGPEPGGGQAGAGFGAQDAPHRQTHQPAAGPQAEQDRNNHAQETSHGAVPAAPRGLFL